MAHLDSKWRKKETAKAIDQNDSNWFCFRFIDKTWESLNNFGFFKLKNCNQKKSYFKKSLLRKTFSTFPKIDIKR